MFLVSEIFVSLQGESSFAGLPCCFIRLAGCNLRCSYCDTAYALEGEFRQFSLEDILERVGEEASVWSGKTIGGHPLPIVEITGGEPMVQAETPELLARLCDKGYTVLLETNGSLSLEKVDSRVRKIVDVKVPSSGESDHNLSGLVDTLKLTDEVKFVVGSTEDYAWMYQFLAAHPELSTRCTVLVSWYDLRAEHASGLKTPPANIHALSRACLAESIIHDALPVRMQVQMHKILWPEAVRGK